MASLDTIVQHFIQKHGLIPQDTPILVAISGGPDSVFLAHILRELGYKIGLAHMNYHLRGEESTLDQGLVEQYANQWQIPYHIQDADPKEYAKRHQKSLQVACRDLRYQFFEEILDKEPYKLCATAHHADDQVETILMSLLRGNGTSVLKGIPVQRERYIRPILPVNKREILAYLDKHHLPYRIDQSNLDKIYIRNQVRHDLIPSLEDIQPAARQQILSRFTWYQAQEQLLHTLLQPYIEGAVRVQENDKYIELAPIQSRLGLQGTLVLLNHVFEAWGIHGHIRQQAVNLLSSESGKWVDTAVGRLMRVRDGFHLSPDIQSDIRQEIQMDSKSWPQVVSWGSRKLEFAREVSFPTDFTLKHKYYLDADQLIAPLYLRSWQTGDRMIPLGMRQHKKLSDIFIDEKYDAIQKQEAWLLCDQKGIVCLGGFRIAERVRLSPESSNILSIFDTDFSE